MNLMLLAAGLGTRLQPYTFQRPKPAIPFLGVPLAAYPLALLDGMKVDKLVVNTHHLHTQVENLFRDMRLPSESLHFSFEKQILGSGGAINNVRSLLKGDGDFIVINADEVICPHDPWLIKEFMAFHKWSKNLATLLVTEHPEVGKKFGGVWVSGKDRVEAFSKIPLPGLKGYHYLGVIAFQDRIFQYFKTPVQDENILYETLALALSQREDVSVFPCKVEWFENGNPTDFVKSSNYYCDQLITELETKRNSSYWKTFLSGAIRYHSTKEKLIEKDHPELSQKLDRLWSLI